MKETIRVGHTTFSPAQVKLFGWPQGVLLKEVNSLSKSWILLVDAVVGEMHEGIVQLLVVRVKKNRGEPERKEYKRTR